MDKIRKKWTKIIVEETEKLVKICQNRQTKSRELQNWKKKSKIWHVRKTEKLKEKINNYQIDF